MYDDATLLGSVKSPLKIYVNIILMNDYIELFTYLSVLYNRKIGYFNTSHLFHVPCWSYVWMWQYIQYTCMYSVVIFFAKINFLLLGTFSFNKSTITCKPRNRVAQICSIRLYMVDKYIATQWYFCYEEVFNQPMYVHILHLTHFYVAVFSSVHSYKPKV